VIKCPLEISFYVIFQCITTYLIIVSHFCWRSFSLLTHCGKALQDLHIGAAGARMGPWVMDVVLTTCPEHPTVEIHWDLMFNRLSHCQMLGEGPPWESLSLSLLFLRYLASNLLLHWKFSFNAWNTTQVHKQQKQAHRHVTHSEYRNWLLKGQAGG
jgi:hypothetical protein